MSKSPEVKESLTLEEKPALAARMLKEKKARPKLAPVSYGQQRLWFLDQLHPHSPLYNIPGAVSLSGPLLLHALRRAAAELLRRHESLRTCFVTRDGSPFQLISPPFAPDLPLLDLSHLPPQQRHAEARSLAAEESSRPFDLSRPPLLLLLRLDEQEHLLLFTLHHIISDDWSLGLLARELSTLYAAFSRGEESPLPELEVQYADYAAWQRRWLEAGVADQQLAYWRSRLADAPHSLNRPTDRPRSASGTRPAGSERLHLSAETAEGLRRLARAHSATPFMALLAALAALLPRHTGERQQIVGTPVAGRRELATEALIGFFVNTLALRVEEI